MKKIFELTIVLLLVFSLFACNENSSALDNSNPSDTQHSQVTMPEVNDSSSEETTISAGQSEENALANVTSSKILVAYFSRVGSTSFDENVDAVTSASLRNTDNGLVGNTQILTELVHKEVGGDVFQVITLEPYPSDYEKTVILANNQRINGIKPELTTKVKNMDSYDIIYLGFPIWAMTIPSPIASFLSEYNFSGKTIVPFCTNGGYGPGQSVSAIKELCPDVTVLDIFAIDGAEVDTAQDKVSQWLRKIHNPNR